MHIVVTSNLARLGLADNSFEAINRQEKELELIFNGAYLENFVEQNISEPIIMGKTILLLKGISSECLKIKDDTESILLNPLTENIKTGIYVIAENEIDDNNCIVKIRGIFRRKENDFYNWVEWIFKFDTCKLLFSSFVTHTDWLNGKLPID